jgi:hypothetical protein
MLAVERVQDGEAPSAVGHPINRIRELLPSRTPPDQDPQPSRHTVVAKRLRSLMVHLAYSAGTLFPADPRMDFDFMLAPRGYDMSLSDPDQVALLRKIQLFQYADPGINRGTIVGVYPREWPDALDMCEHLDIRHAGALQNRLMKFHEHYGPIA